MKKKLEYLKTIDRKDLREFSELPNVGSAMSADFRLLGFKSPQDLVGQDPFSLFEKMCQMSGPQDPCVLDTYISVVRYMDGESPLPWWTFTSERKNEMNRRKKAQI